MSSTCIYNHGTCPLDDKLQLNPTELHECMRCWDKNKQQAGLPEQFRPCNYCNISNGYGCNGILIGTVKTMKEMNESIEVIFGLSSTCVRFEPCK